MIFVDCKMAKQYNITALYYRPECPHCYFILLSVYPPFPDDDAWIDSKRWNQKNNWLDIVMSHSNIAK